MSEQEGEMLDFAAAERQAGSRLACQIEMTDALDGLRLTLPAAQI
jgi:2Fe-2S ferredoxin